MPEPVTPGRSDVASGHSHDRRRLRWRQCVWPSTALAAITLLAVFQLRNQGRLWWCACGLPHLWSGDTWSRHNSQHLFDPYVFTHALHGILLFGLLAWAFPRMSLAWRFVLANSFEAAWEVLENTAVVIQRYRAVTASRDYLGDTIANSLGDILGFGAGLWLARRLGFRGSLVAFIATELILLVWIRDSLLLNVLMLLYPIEAVRAWQLGH